MADKDILTFDIHDITTVTEKHESAGFEFRNPARVLDGFVLFTGGKAELSIYGEKTLTVKKDDFIIFNQNDSYRFYAEKPCSYITCGFFMDYPFGNKNKALPRLLKCNTEQVKKIRTLSDEWEQHRYESAMVCKIGIMSFYLELFKMSADKELLKADPVVTRALDFLHSNFKRNFRSEEIAHYCSVSESHLRSKFSSSVGMTITEYRDRLRIKAARELLSGGEFSVKETASELGFCDVYHFSKFFTKYAMTTPAKFAKNPKQ